MISQGLRYRWIHLPLMPGESLPLSSILFTIAHPILTPLPIMNVLLAEDHPVYRRGIRQMIEEEEELNLVFETGDGSAALDEIRKGGIDIAVLDINMPGLGGLEIARTRMREQLKVKIVFLTMFDERGVFNEALDLEVDGYILKDSEPDEILQAILKVSHGSSWFSPRFVDFLLDRHRKTEKIRDEIPGLTKLTNAERQVLKMIATNMSTKEIAASLNLSPRTISNHRSSISTKLGLQGSHSLLRFAFSHRSQL